MDGVSPGRLERLSHTKRKPATEPIKTKAATRELHNDVVQQERERERETEKKAKAKTQRAEERACDRKKGANTCSEVKPIEP